MRVVTAILFASLLIAGTASATDRIVVLGKALSHDWAGVDIECPPDSICLNGWTRWQIAVVRTVEGPKLPHRINAAHLQHLLYSHMSPSVVQLFVLVPIEDPKERAKLRADYYIEDFSDPHTMYCLEQSPQSNGLPVEEADVYSDDAGNGHCFELPVPGK